MTQKELEFTSQRCTTKEQSQQLLEMGLKPETADMTHHLSDQVKSSPWELEARTPTLSREFWERQRIAELGYWNRIGKESLDNICEKDIPAWSLSRLLELLPNKIKVAEHEFIFSLTHEYDGSWCASYCGIKFFIKGTVFEACTSMIEWLIKNDYFNKDYLQ